MRTDINGPRWIWRRARAPHPVRGVPLRAQLLSVVLAQFSLISHGLGGAPEEGGIPAEYLVPRDVPRRALVLGNGQYLHLDPVMNATNDADAVAAQLESLQFQVIKRLNTHRAELFTAVDDLAAELNEGDLVTIYYAGHGLESEHVNYLLPVEARQWPAPRVPYETLPTSYILETVMSKQPSAVILILDACREKPFEDDKRGVGRNGGLASEEAPAGALIAFAASPGLPAWSGSSQQSSINSVYTSALVKHIRTPSVQIENIFKQVRSSVLRASKNQQLPWESTSLLGDIILMATADDRERDRRVWIETLNTADRSIISAFLTHFPTSQYTGAARQWLKSEPQDALSSEFEPSVWAGSLESSSIVMGTQDFRRLAITAKDVSLIATDDPSISHHIGSGTPVEVLSAPDDQGRVLVEASGKTGYVAGVTTAVPWAIGESRKEVMMYQSNGALPDQVSAAVAKLAASSFLANPSPSDRVLWQLDMQLPACQKARCAGGHTPRQLAWLNALQLRSAIAAQGTGKKSLIIRVPDNDSNPMRNAVAITSSAESMQ